MDLDAIFDQAHESSPTVEPTPPGVTDLGTIGLSDRTPDPSSVSDIGIAAPSNSKSLNLDDIFDSAHAAGPVSATDVNSVSGELGKGLTLGWFDEFQGLDKAAQNSFLSLLGRGNGKSFGENYNTATAKARAQDDAYEAAHPKTALGLNIAGGLIPAVFSGGTGLAAEGAAEGAASLGALGSVVRSAGRNLYGVGLKKGSPSIFQLMKMGAIGGGVAGAGDSDENRLKGALVGAGLGTVAGPVLGKSVEYGTKTIGNLLAERGALPSIQGIKQALTSGDTAAQRGAIGEGGLGPAYTPEELVLAKQLKNTPVDKVRAGAGELDQAIANDVPLFLPEAVNSPKVDRNARFVANFEPSMEFSQSAIKARTEGAEGRASSLFNSVSPIDDAYTGAKRMVTAADDIFTKAEKLRTETAAPLYAKAYSDVPEINSPALTGLVEKDQVLANTIKALKKTANNADLPDNSTELLVKARHRIGDTIEELKGKGKLQEARDLQDTYARLNTILKSENPALADADRAYQAASKDIEALNETFLKNLRNISDDKIGNVGQVFELPARRIEQLRATFEDAGKLDEWNAGIRSYLQKTIESSREGQNFTNKLTGSTFQKEKLTAAIGDNAEPVLQGLDFERRMFEGKNKYHAGSSTVGNLAENRGFNEAIGALAKLKRADWKGALADLFPDKMPDEIAQGLARIYFDPKRGGEALQKILPLLEQYAQNRAASAALGKGAATASTRVGPDDLISSLDPHPGRGGSSIGSAPSKQRIPELEQGSGSRSSGRVNAEPSTQNPPHTTSSLGSFESGSPSGDATTAPSATQGKPGGLFRPVAATATDLALADGAQGSGLFDKALSNLKSGKNMDAEPPKKTNIAVVERQIDSDPYLSALYEAESGRNPNAKNPNSSAAGGFQFVKATAKSIGLLNPMDLEKSLIAVRKLTDEHRNAIGDDDPAKLYAAHFLGLTVYNKWKRGAELSDKERAQVNDLQKAALPRFMRIYGNVLKRTGQLVA